MLILTRRIGEIMGSHREDAPDEIKEKPKQIKDKYGS
jgi:hypothetical protein